MVGNIPPEIGTFFAMTSYISFFNAQTGPIPSTLGYILPLETFDVESNNLDGPLFQPEYAGPDGLREIVNFRASLNNFIGTIPAEIGQWTKVQNLWFADNQITGTIPTEIGNLAEMGKFVLSNYACLTFTPIFVQTSYQKLCLTFYLHYALVRRIPLLQESNSWDDPY